MRDEEAAGYALADRLQVLYIYSVWLEDEPFGQAQVAFRRRCRCTFSQYCGPGCGGHSE